MDTDHPPADHSSPDAKGKQVEAEQSRAQPAEGTLLQNGSKVHASATHDPDHHAPRAAPSESNGSANVDGNHHSVADPGQAPAASQAPFHPESPQEPNTSSSSSSAFPSGGKERPEEPDQQKETDSKDKNSLDTTLAGTQTFSHGLFRKDGKSSDGAHTMSSMAEQPERAPKHTKRHKSSVFVKLFRVFVPCVGHTHAHIIDVESGPLHQPQVGADADASTSALKGKLALKEAEKLPPPPPAEEPMPSAPPEEIPEVPQPAPPVETDLPTGPPDLSLQPLDIPEQPEDPAVIVPPTPTKLLPEEETHNMTSGAVQPPGSTGEESLHEHAHHGRDSGDESDGSTSFTEDEEMEEPNRIDEVEDEEERLIMNGGTGIPIGPDGVEQPLLPPILPKHAGRKCLVLDLDETLVHSSFKSIQQADYVVPVEIEYHLHNVYVIKRPGVDNFLKKMGEIYEVVVFTASLSKYADPVLDKLDIHQVVSHRLFRESCYNHRGNYVKDLSQLGRSVSDTIILDNSPASYIFHPNNAVPVSSWFNDPHDTELTDLCPFLADLGQVDDVRGVLDGGL
ncbi:predicted protein [Sparassis crispa]|uniref:FCP1 homology domain-containing protein n=1 Tax=Sparassis crispa TaxID=139825 RepID=A0A401GEV2_9APHY|nr:predicted protein [Sparassis crispa]GBE80706.1 predicted protein [Sparassis crispa]